MRCCIGISTGKRQALRLSDEQAFAARTGAQTHLLSVLVGLMSVLLALTVPIEWIWTAGVIYALQGPLHWRNGVLIARAREKRFLHRAPTRDRASFIDASAPVSSSRDRQVQKRM